MSSEPHTVHTYDGIEEHDNHLPRWWLMTLWGTVVFAFGYWGYYHTFKVGPLPREALAAELAVRQAAEVKAAAAAPVVDDAALAALTTDAAAVERGRAVYAVSCLACHGAQGEGLVGPNLTDAVWVHPNKPTELLDLVSNGVLDKGMPAWKPALGADKVKDVVVFVMTLKGKNVVGKAPQGEIPTSL
jgi:cytochrome c oxidase cbb3-type subunit 3